MHHITQFRRDLQSYGLKTAIDNALIIFMKWFIDAKRIQITYNRRNRG